MDTTSTPSNLTRTRLERWLAEVWRFLKHPGLTAVLLVVLALALLIAWSIPQQATLTTPADTWLAALPPTLQTWGEPLYALGFSRVLYSPWLWLPLAALLLNSLVALADYGRPSWQRFRAGATAIDWQHPLAERQEYSVRLPAAPDEHLDTLKTRLAEQGFTVSLPDPEEPRLVGAARRTWTWLAVIGFYGSLIVLCLGFVLTRYSLQTEQLVLWPFKPADSQLFDSQAEIYAIEPDGQRGTVIFDPNETTQPALAFVLQPYRPVFFKQVLIWPTTIEPVITIQAKDETGQERRLLPAQVDLLPTTRLSLPLTESGDPLYFSIPTADLAFQLQPETGEGEAAYQVEVRRIRENILLENLAVRSGESFEVDNLSLVLTNNYNLHFIARRDFGLPFYLLSVGLMLASGLLWLGFAPWHVWLIADVKGRGGQLYGVVESPGSVEALQLFLEELLRSEEPPDENSVLVG